VCRVCCTRWNAHTYIQRNSAPTISVMMMVVVSGGVVLVLLCCWLGRWEGRGEWAVLYAPPRCQLSPRHRHRCSAIRPLCLLGNSLNHQQQQHLLCIVCGGVV